MEKREEIERLFSLQLRNLLKRMTMEYELLQEIRLRAGQPLFVRYGNREYFVEESGVMKQKTDKPYRIRENEIRETMEYISNYSLYAFEEEIRQGFLTVRGGHRVGVAGKIILERERIKAMKYIHFLNIRFAHEVKGCADEALKHLFESQDACKKGDICHTLILSPPGCGKTTLLRDLVRQLSNGSGERQGRNIGLVDERSEIGACYMGVPQNDLGIRTDVLDCCPKAEGMMMLIRSMSPDIIAVDEIGSNADVEAIERTVYCGCRLIGTVHGSSMEELLEKPVLKNLLGKGIFKRFIILESREKAGSLKGIYNEKGARLF